MNKVDIINNTDEDLSLILIDDLIKFTLKKEQVTNAIFNVIIIDDNKIQEINREYRGKDYPTDVISFALEDDKNFITLDFRVLGDIYISIDTAKRQAIEFKHSLDDELAFLTVHGLLHLLGYDHMEIDEEKIMFEKQELILNEYKQKNEK